MNGGVEDARFERLSSSFCSCWYRGVRCAPSFALALSVHIASRSDYDAKTGPKYPNGLSTDRIVMPINALRSGGARQVSRID